MTIDWLTFFPALVLLLTPGDLFNGGKIRFRDVSRDWNGYWRLTFAHGLHTIDLARAALGTWLLLGSLHGAANPHGFQKYEALFLPGVISIFATFIQAAVCREEDSINAPFAFVTGLLLGGSSPIVALFAVALALTAALGSRTPAAFFPVLGLAHLGVGLWFKGKSAVLSLSFDATAAMIPFFWAIMFRREMVVAYRAKRREGAKHSPLR